MFQFNFFQKENQSDQHNTETIETSEAKEHPPLKKHDFPVSPLSQSSTSWESLSITNMTFYKKVMQKHINALPACISSVVQKSDVESGVYEGGFKVWECTYDLLDYLAKHPQLIKDKEILDLGCAHGLVGIFCIVNGAARVDFQDFNADVIEHATIPNVMKNCPDWNDSVCTSGDWADIPKALQTKKYDLILSSESLYQESSYPSLLHLCRQLLKPSSKGIALFAQKSYYFGVGGSVHGFLQLLRKDFLPYFLYENLSIIEDGVSTRRELFQLTHL